MVNNIKQFNSENKSWKIHVNKLISISNDDLIIDTTSENNKIFLLKDTVVKNINVSNIDVSNISSFVTDKLDVSFIDISNDALVQGKSINNVIDRFNIIDNAIQDNKIYFKSLLNNNNFELLQENIWYDISFLNYQFSSSTINNLVDSNGLFKIPRDGIYLIEVNYFLND